MTGTTIRPQEAVVASPWIPAAARPTAAPAPVPTDPSPVLDSAVLSDTSAAAAPEPIPAWRRAALAGCALLSLAGGVNAGPLQTAVSNAVQTVVSLPVEGAKAVANLPGDVASSVLPVGKQPGDVFPHIPDSTAQASLRIPADTAAPTTIEGTRERLQAIQVPAMDPYVFTVASEAWESLLEAPPRETESIKIPDAYGKSIKVDLNLSHGPNAPMLVILPGAFGSRRSNKVGLIEKMAHDNGMNFVAFDNPLNPELEARKPVHFPGNPQEESRVVLEALLTLRAKHPAEFAHVSVTGYSYGGMLAMGLVDAQAGWLADHPGEKLLINGSVATVSPPEYLADSMERLDTIHNQVSHEHSGSTLLAVLHYRSYVRKHDFHTIDPNAIAYTPDAATERYLIDKRGFRDAFQQMVDNVDQTFGVYALPLNKARHENPFLDRDQEDWLRHNQWYVLNGMTYDDYMGQYVSRDPWFTQNKTTPQQVLEHSRYSTLLESARAQGIPVMTVTAADDFILKPSNVATFRALEQNPSPNEATVVLPHGGHTGEYYSPEVRTALIDFLKAPPATQPSPAASAARRLAPRDAPSLEGALGGSVPAPYPVR